MKQVRLPNWLYKEEIYLPQTDKDTFVNKSILSLLSVLSKIKAQSFIKPAKYKVNAVFKVAFTLLSILLLSISKSLAFVIFIIAYLLVVLCFMDAKDIVKILKVSLVAAAFTFLVLLPAAFLGNRYSSVIITAKLFASITAVNILSRTEKWSSITSALKRFYIPDIFIFVLDITVKYIVMLGDFSLNMLYALKLRSIGKNKGKYSSLSGIGGTIFIKSREMAEDMYHAMECRGFTGEYFVYSRFKFTAADWIYIMIHVGILFVFFYFERF